MKMTLYDAGIMAFYFRNDIHCLHFNVTGIDFKDVHEWLGELYNQALDNFDYFMEHAVLTNEIESVPNMSIILKEQESVARAWHPVDSALFSVESALDTLINQFKDYSEVLDAVREYCENKDYNDIASDIDQIKSDWVIEVKYKAVRTLQ
jgi:DNA-binding ferritin-like protein